VTTIGRFLSCFAAPLVLLGLSWCAFDLSNVHSSTGLALSIKVKSVKYCRGDAELFTVHLNLRLRYKNQADHPIIVHAGDPIIGHVRISRNMADARAGRFEVDSSADILTAGESPAPLGSAPDKRFVILKPGETFGFDSFAAIVARRDTSPLIAGTIPPGEHVLQVVVNTWPFSDLDPEKARSLWFRFGELHSDPVASEPVPLTIHQNPEWADCSE